jgi:flagella basal body P-ring formation protein FlgA
MTSSGSLAVLFSLQTLLASAADSLAPAPLPRPLERRVAERFAEAWNVPPAAVRLAWGRSTAASRLDPTAPFRVLGRGAGGWYAVVFHPAERQALAVQVRAGLVETTCVAARPLARGARLAAADLREEPHVRWGPPGARSTALGTERPGEGWEVRRPIATGDRLAWPAVAPPPMVVAGQPVRLEWEREGVRVAFVGVALNDARCGETVLARVPERPARLLATVTAPGVAQLPAARGPGEVSR